MAPCIRLAWREVAEHGQERRTVAWALVRELVGTDAAIDNTCPRCGGPHGPLRLTDAPFRASVSYAVGDGRTVAVAGVIPDTDAAGFGIDAEPIGREVGDALGRPATLRDWVRVEATLKADGRALHLDAGLVEVFAPEGQVTREVDSGRSGPPERPGPPERTAWTARLPGRVLRGVDLAGPAGILVSSAWVPAEEAASGRARR